MLWVWEWLLYNKRGMQLQENNQPGVVWCYGLSFTQICFIFPITANPKENKCDQHET